MLLSLFPPGALLLSMSWVKTLYMEGPSTQHFVVYLAGPNILA